MKKELKELKQLKALYKLYKQIGKEERKLQKIVNRMAKSLIRFHKNIEDFGINLSNFYPEIDFKYFWSCGITFFCRINDIVYRIKKDRQIEIVERDSDEDAYSMKSYLYTKKEIEEIYQIFNSTFLPELEKKAQLMIKVRLSSLTLSHAQLTK